MTDNNDGAVAWEERHRGPDGEWRAWTPCSKAYFDGYANTDSYQNRALVPASKVEELRARAEVAERRVAELEAALSACNDLSTQRMIVLNKEMRRAKDD